MVIFKEINALKNYLQGQSLAGTVGFVPTMGALHEGHLALIRTAKAENQTVVCSIFVNPSQFNDPKDFKKYPVTIEADIRKLAETSCDILFLPAVATIYPDGLDALEQYDLGMLDTVFEGATRPGHFQGVCQVVNRLLGIVEPDLLYLGQKDYQQCMVIRRLMDLTEKKTKIRICATMRESNGLAMSSRNMRLSPAARETAAAIYHILTYAKQHLSASTVPEILYYSNTYLQQHGFKPVYIAIANAENLYERENWDGKEKLVMLVAAFIEEVRLIDNMLLS